MVRLQATKVPIDVDALAEAARREPVTVMSGDEEAFVVVAPAEFRRIVEAAGLKRAQDWDRLERTLGEIHRRVALEMSPDEIARLEREIVDDD